MAEAERPAGDAEDAEASKRVGMTTDPVIRTALLSRRIRELGAELRDVPGSTRDLIIKLWSHGGTPTQIAVATNLPEGRIKWILNIGGPTTWDRR